MQEIVTKEKKKDTLQKQSSAGAYKEYGDFSLPTFLLRTVPGAICENPQWILAEDPWGAAAAELRQERPPQSMHLTSWTTTASSSTVRGVQTQKPPGKVYFSPSFETWTEEQITALSPQKKEKLSNNNTFPGQPEKWSDQLSCKMIILSAKTMIGLHSNTKGILKVKHTWGEEWTMS